MQETLQMRTWAEVSLDRLAHNYRVLRDLAGPGCRFLGLVKADAYGHGAPRVAAKLEALGCEMLAVACVEEAAELREAGIRIPILCLGLTPPELFPLLQRFRVTQTVADLPTARAYSRQAVASGLPLTVHLKLDTGMSRIGFLWREEAEAECVEALSQVCALPGLDVEGMFTHFSDADGSRDYTLLQFGRFQRARELLRARGGGPRLFHCAASAAALALPETHLDMIRPGIALYGYSPLPEQTGPELLPVLQCKTRVAAVRSLPAGTFVSYGRTARLERDSLLAVLPVGYGDGFPRLLSGRMRVLLGGKLCPILGRICMDMCMVDVTEVPGVQPGDTAVLYGREGLTELACELMGTIPYELLCSLSPRVPRIYIEEG